MNLRERDKIISEFKSVEKGVLVNCNVLTVGIDLPIVDSIIFYGESSSSECIIQRIGRCLRLYLGKYRSNVVILLEPTDENTEEKNNKRNICKILKMLINNFPFIKERILREREYKGTMCRNIMIECGEEGKGYSELVYDRFFNFDLRLEELRKFVEEKGKMPTDHSNEKIESSLGKWINNQKSNYRKHTLSRERITELENIDGWMWENNFDEIWEEKYKGTKKFIKDNNKYPDKRNLTDEGEKTLGRWVSRQKKFYSEGRMDKNRKIRLEELKDWKWPSDFKNAWNNDFEKVKKYKEKYGVFPSGSVDKHLAQWIGDQKKYYRNNLMFKSIPISQERINKLETIKGWVWPIPRYEIKITDKLILFFEL